MFLLDVNVLVALLDPAHVHHVPANYWFDEVGHHAWATCPITENGVFRVLLNTRYRNKPRAPAVVAELVQRQFSIPGRVFWPDDFSLFDTPQQASGVQSAGLVTDVYLLMLAQRHDAKLASFDRRLASITGSDLASSLHLIEAY
jgi:toxin-antitoxin system PIN domain toxin